MNGSLAEAVNREKARVLFVVLFVTASTQFSLSCGSPISPKPMPRRPLRTPTRYKTTSKRADPFPVLKWTITAVATTNSIGEITTLFSAARLRPISKISRQGLCRPERPVPFLSIAVQSNLHERARGCDARKEARAWSCFTPFDCHHIQRARPFQAAAWRMLWQADHGICCDLHTSPGFSWSGSLLPRYQLAGNEHQGHRGICDHR